MTNTFRWTNRDVKLTMLTAYDAVTASLEAECGVDILLVGDSVGTNVLGYDSPKSVTLSDMIHHTRAVRRGAPNAFVLADLPFGTYTTPEDALANANQLVTAGADAIKAEGAIPEICAYLVHNGIQFCGHLGFTPQLIDRAAVQSKTVDEAAVLLRDSLDLQTNGCTMLVLELVPEEVAAFVTAHLTLPTIGIGSGRYTSGQVLVINDLIGLNARHMRHSARYAETGTEIKKAVAEYVKNARSGSFPNTSHASHMSPQDILGLENLEPHEQQKPHTLTG